MVIFHFGFLIWIKLGNYSLVNNIVLSPNIAKPIGEDVYEIIDQDVLSHLKTFLKLKEGSFRHLKVIVPGEGQGSGQFEFNNLGDVRVKVKDLTKTKKRRVHLAIASTRPPMAKRILEHATTLGAASFNFFTGDLSEKSYLDSKVYDENQAIKYVEKGMAQCSQFSSFPIFSKDQNLESVIKKFQRQNCVQYWLDKDAINFFDKNISNEDLCLYIGPERGWSQRELELFESFNILGVKLSDSVMRVEFAVNAAFAQIEYISNRGLDV